MSSTPQPGLRAAKRLAATLLAGAAFAAGPASAQELVHTFTNPSFGGNPFYSEHLLATANIHRPDEPEEPTDPPLTEEEEIAEQLRSQFVSDLTGAIRRRIQTARPGDTGQFELGDQRISFVRTATETQITFLNTRTGETRRVVVPAGSNTDPFGATPAQMAAAGQMAVPLIPGQTAPANRQVSAEQALGAIGAATGRPGSGLSSGLLDPRSLELPLGGN